MSGPRGTDAEQEAPDAAAAGAAGPGAPRAEGPLEPAADPGPRWAQGPGAAPADGRSDATTVLPGGTSAGARRSSPPRPVPPRPAQRGEARPAAGSSTRAVAGRTRRARLTLKRIDAWSVFLFSLVASVFVGIALVVAVAVLYSVVGALGITESLNQLFTEVTGGNDPLLTTGRIVGGAAVLAAVNVVFLTLLATLSALLYNLCASFTGGIELVLGERD